MDIGPPPPPLIFFGSTPTATPDTAIPQPTYNNAVPGAVTDDSVPPHHHRSSSPTSSSPVSSVIIVIIVISSAIILSTSIYLLIRFLSRRYNRTTSPLANDVVSSNRNENEHQHVHHHVVSIDNNSGVLDSLPIFTFSSLTGKIAGGDCAVCLSKFEGADQLRLLPLCCHAFHTDCIDVWLKSNQTCPLCRSSVNPTDADILNKLASRGGGIAEGNRSNSFRIEIGSISRRREPYDPDRRSYSLGSYEYVLDDGYEIPVESTLSTHRGNDSVSNCTSDDKDWTNPVPPGENLAAEVGGGVGSGRRNWLRDYVDRVSVSLSSRSVSLRGSGRFLFGSSRRSEAVNDIEATHSRIGEEISELFRWFSGV